MRRVILLLILAAALAPPASAQWRRAGLAGEAIGAIAVDPSNADTAASGDPGTAPPRRTRLHFAVCPAISRAEAAIPGIGRSAIAA